MQNNKEHLEKEMEFLIFKAQNNKIKMFHYIKIRQFSVKDILDIINVLYDLLKENRSQQLLNTKCAYKMPPNK